MHGIQNEICNFQSVLGVKIYEMTLMDFTIENAGNVNIFCLHVRRWLKVRTRFLDFRYETIQKSSKSKSLYLR